MPSSIRESDTESEGASVAPRPPPPWGEARAAPARESGPAEGTRAEPAVERDRSVALARALRGVGRFARRKPLGALGALIVVAMLVMAAFAERIAPYDYDETVRGARMKPPSAAHWLGTDNLSRDMWSRVVYGARVSITVGFATIGLAIFLATVIGVSSGYFGGAYDLVIQRLVDAWLSFPYLVIILSVMAVLGPGLLNLVVALAILVAAINSRVIRGAAIAVAQSTYVEAARALGCGHARIIARHILPNVMATIIILATIGRGAGSKEGVRRCRGRPVRRCGPTRIKEVLDGDPATGPGGRAVRSLLAARAAPKSEGP